MTAKISDYFIWAMYDSDQEVDNVGVKAALSMLRFYKSLCFSFPPHFISIGNYAMNSVSVSASLETNGG